MYSKSSCDNPRSKGFQQNSSSSGQSHNFQHSKNNKKRNNNTNSSSSNNNNQRNFEYVRKIDTQEGKEELLRKQQQIEEEEKQRQLQVRQQQEDDERQRQLVLEYQYQQQLLEQQKQIKSFILDDIISSICADAENHALQRKYFKSIEGLTYLLESNFSDFDHVVSVNLPDEVIAFNSRQYIEVPIEINLGFRKRHKTSYNQTHKLEDQSSPNNSQYSKNSQYQNSRMTVRQRLSTFSNKNSFNNNQNYNDSSVKNQQIRNKNLTSFQDSRTVEDDEQKWRQSRAPLFTQSKDELKFLLNVLTPDNFNNLKEQFYQLCKNDIDKCINSLINKVCKEGKYTKLYAQLAIYVKDREEQEQDKINPDNNSGEVKSFKAQMFQMLQDFFYDQKKLNSILSGCQNSKECRNEEDEDEDETFSQQTQDTDTSLSDIREKKRFQIFLKFLGELFLHKFMPKKIISYCIQTMIQKYVNGGLKSEDRNLEGVIALIDAIGLDFEASWKNSHSRQMVTDLSFLDQIRNQFNPNAQVDAHLKLDSDLFENQFISFEGVMKILKYLNPIESISIRIRSLITNLIYRWDNNWEKALHQKEDPRTLQELHRQHYDELNKRQQEVQEHYSNLEKNSYKLKKQNSQYSRNQPVDYNKEIKRIFTEVDNNNCDLDEYVQQLANLGINNILQNLFSCFFDARLENLGQRYKLMNSILSQNSFQKSIFLSALNNALNSLYTQACDFPHLNESFSIVLCPLILSGQLDLNQINQYPCNDPDEDEDKTYFFREFKQHCSSFLKSSNYFMCED